MYRVLYSFLILLLSLPVFSQKTYTLQQCIDSALAKNIPVKRAGLQTEVAHTNWRQSRYNLLPDLNAGIRHDFNYGRSLNQSNAYVSANSNIGGYNLNSNLILFNGLSLQSRIKQNAYAHEASKMEHQQAKDELVMNVILAYLLVLNNEDQLSVSIQQELTSRATVERLNVLNSQGAVRPSDFTDLQGQLMNDQLAIINSKNDLESVKLRLAQLMQIKYDSSMRVERMGVEEFLTLYNASPEEIYQTSLDQFARIKAVELRTKSSTYTVKAERGQLYPSLSFGAGMGSSYFSTFTTASGSKIPYMDQLKNNKSTYIGFGLNIPIFNAFSTRNRIKLATINQRDNELVEEDTKLQLRQQIDQAYLQMKNAFDRYKILLEQVNAYRESFKAAEIRFNAGVGTSVDYLTSKDRYDRANINLVNAKYDFVLRKRILDYYRGE